jgi:hypothetical protein
VQPVVKIVRLGSVRFRDPLTALAGPQPQIPPPAGVGWHDRFVRNGLRPSNRVYRLPFLPFIIIGPFCEAYPASLIPIVPKVTNATPEVVLSS